MTGDLPDALHFHHFEQAHVNVLPATKSNAAGRVRIKGEVKIKGPVVDPTRRHVKLRS